MVAKWPFTPPPEPPRTSHPPPLTGWRLFAGVLLAAGASALIAGGMLGVIGAIAWWVFRWLTGV
jgi:hypothetical protein